MGLNRVGRYAWGEFDSPMVKYCLFIISIPVGWPKNSLLATLVLAYLVEHGKGFPMLKISSGGLHAVKRYGGTQI